MKIGFLAMSGIRAHDPKLLELGLTLPGFVERSRVVASLPSLGLLYLAAVTPPGHELHYFEAEADGAEPPQVYDCDLVAINTFSAQVFEAYAVADRLRSRGVKVAMGGLHVTLPMRSDAQDRILDYLRQDEDVEVQPAHVADLPIESAPLPEIADASSLQKSSVTFGPDRDCISIPQGDTICMRKLP